MKTFLAVAVVAALAAACNSILAIKDPTLEDAGGGGGSDGSTDGTPIDSAIDSTPIDSAIDGPPPVCTTGACCSPAGQFEPTTKVCNTATVFRCNGASNCGAQPQQSTVQTFCSGTSAVCDGMVMNGAFSDVGASCTADQVCRLNGALAPTCTSCNGFGCNPTANACRPEKLFLLLSIGGFQGGRFAGSRAAIDAQCATDFADPRFPNRACNPAHAHAMISIPAAGDLISGMAVKFGIPTTAPLHRVDDDVRVTNNWNDLINPNTALSAPASTASPTSGNGFVWTGANGSDHCNSWSVSTNPPQGVRGDTTITQPSWFNINTLGCNLTSHLLCVCWSGP